MIIGYYGQSFFGGGTYIKVFKKDSESYNLESISFAVPNYIPDAEKYIGQYESIRKSERFRKLFGENTFLNEGKISEKTDVEKLIEYIKTIDFEKLSEKEYYDEGILDGLCWEIFVEIDGKKWRVQGYEDMPKEIEKIQEKLMKCVENTSLSI